MVNSFEAADRSSGDVFSTRDFEKNLKSLSFDETKFADKLFDSINSSNYNQYTLIRGEILGVREPESAQISRDAFNKYVNDQGGVKFLEKLFLTGKGALSLNLKATKKKFEEFRAVIAMYDFEGATGDESGDVPLTIKEKNMAKSTYADKIRVAAKKYKLFGGDVMKLTFEQAVSAGIFGDSFTSVDVGVIEQGLSWWEYKNRETRQAKLKRGSLSGTQSEVLVAGPSKDKEGVVEDFVLRKNQLAYDIKTELDKYAETKHWSALKENAGGLDALDNTRISSELVQNGEKLDYSYFKDENSSPMHVFSISVVKNEDGSYVFYYGNGVKTTDIQAVIKYGSEVMKRFKKDRAREVWDAIDDREKAPGWELDSIRVVNDFAKYCLESSFRTDFGSLSVEKTKDPLVYRLKFEDGKIYSMKIDANSKSILVTGDVRIFSSKDKKTSKIYQNELIASKSFQSEVKLEDVKVFVRSLPSALEEKVGDLYEKKFRKEIGD